MADERWEIILSGIGGQGLVSSGNILGEAASEYEDKFVTMTMTYGVSARGGFSKSDILIDEEFVPYYKALNPGIVLVLADKAYGKIKDKIGPETLVIINEDEVENYDENLGDVHSFPLSELAFEVGSLKTLNVLALSLIVGKTGLIKRENLEKTIANKYPEAKELNMKAVEKGFELAQ